MPRAAVSRRRVLRVLAAAPGFLLPGTAPARDGAPLVAWRGPVLGAAGEIALHHPDRPAAERLPARASAEMRRLEGLFSFWRAHSPLAELNRSGVLVAPPPDMVRLLSEAPRVAELTGGVFDPTVQPVWRLYRSHFEGPGAGPDGPPRAALDEALSRVGHRHLRVGPDRVLWRGAAWRSR